jgi:hypothetical protein
LVTDVKDWQQVSSAPANGRYAARGLKSVVTVHLPTLLQDVLEGWIALGLALHHPIPAIDGCTISVALAS